MHVATALVLRRFVRRTTVILGLAVLTSAAMHHAFLASDPWHMADAQHAGPRAPRRARRRRKAAGGCAGRDDAAVAVGVVAASLLPVLWLANGGAVPINTRLARIAAGEERPSKGTPYDYPDLPRAGDLGIGGEHLDPVRYVRAHTTPDQPVYFTTWMLGGGTEAFLAQRRNPTSFDKPDEVLLDPQRDQLRAELQRDPPALIVGAFFDYLGDETRRLIAKDWRVVVSKPIEIRERVR